MHCSCHALSVAHFKGPVACAGTVGELAESAPSWRIYRQEFLRTMAFGEWETYDHPVACESIPVSGVNLRTSVQICSRDHCQQLEHNGERFPLGKALRSDCPAC